MTYTIGQVEELTGVKTHILRYWEEVIPGFIPQKDISGRRIYTQQEVELIFRLKYLINEKKYTLEGAGQQIIREAGTHPESADLIQKIHETRALLSELFIKVKEL
ncbi:MAG: MerR family transcriptional regulator [Treponema sp.]|nr:MerR family transcriptional regulator [Treponema sp.]